MKRLKLQLHLEKCSPVLYISQEGSLPPREQ